LLDRKGLSKLGYKLLIDGKPKQNNLRGSRFVRGLRFLTGCWKDSYAISDQPYAKYPLITLSILQELLGNLLNPEN
jgi:hypothetical protein